MKLVFRKSESFDTFFKIRVQVYLLRSPTNQFVTCVFMSFLGYAEIEFS